MGVETQKTITLDGSVNRPITNRLPMTEHFGKYLSILLHFE
jgi:hypothetical protein